MDHLYVKVLLNHIREKLPDMKARLNTLMGQTQQELNSFGDAAFLQGDQHQVCDTTVRFRQEARVAEFLCVGLPDPQANDPVRAGLRFFHRRHIAGHLHKGALRRRPDLLYLQRCLRARTRIHKLDF